MIYNKGAFPFNPEWKSANNGGEEMKNAAAFGRIPLSSLNLLDNDSYSTPGSCVTLRRRKGERGDDAHRR